MRGKQARGGSGRRAPWRRLCLTLLLLLPTAASATFEPAPELDVSPPVILVLPSEWSTPEAPAILRARIGDRSGIGRVTAWVMGENDEDYRPYPMQLAPDGGYETRLPAWQGRGSILVYFVEAFDLLGNGPRRSAGPGNPFVLRAEEVAPVPIEQSAGSRKQLAVGLLLAPLALLWLMYRQDRGQRERRFWVETLEPLTDLRGTLLVQAIDGVCSRTVRHPYRGEVRLSRIEVRRWMHCLRESGELPPRRPTLRQPVPWRRRASEGDLDGDVVWLPPQDDRPQF
jgi:hypothetical protein